MTALHTPGPWKIADIRMLVSAGWEKYDWEKPLPNPKVEANARLIAAAPDLLAALSLAFDEIHNPGAGRSRGIDILAIIEAAFSKARGQ